MMIRYRISIRDFRRSWHTSVPAESEMEALKTAIKAFKSERGYEPLADDIFIAPDVEQFFS